MTSPQERYDLVILGSGSTAFAAALHAAELGKSAVMAEFRTVGGTCANRGCLPSKNLIEAARLVYDVAHPRYPGLTPVHMPFSWAELVAQKDEIIEEYRAHKYESLLDDPDHMQVVPGQARLVSDHEVEVQSADGARRLIGSQLLIATGSEVALALEARERLEGEGIPTRVVSMPSSTVFDRQPREYRESVIPPGVRARLAIEAGASLGWKRYVGDGGDSVSLDRYGASAPGEVVLRELGFSVENVVRRAKALL